MANGLAGWYPDPGGQPGQFRYWDGQDWSQSLSPTPYAPPPTSPAYGGAPGGYGATSSTPGFDPTAPISTSGNLSAPIHSQTGPGQPSAYTQGLLVQPKQKRAVGPVLIVVALVVVIGLVAWQIVARLGGTIDPTGGSTTSGGGTKTQPCPPEPTVAPEEKQHPNDGWVYGGNLAYPAMGGTWSEIQTDYRLAFGRDTHEQVSQLHTYVNTHGEISGWVASVIVAELWAGDGFYTPQEGSEIVTRCIIETFYDDAAITRTDVRNEGLTFAGKEAWIVETNLAFDIPNLPTKSEWLIILIVATTEMSSSIFYSSVPADCPDQVFSDVRNAYSQLRLT